MRKGFPMKSKMKLFKITFCLFCFLMLFVFPGLCRAEEKSVFSGWQKSLEDNVQSLKNTVQTGVDKITPGSSKSSSPTVSDSRASADTASAPASKTPNTRSAAPSYAPPPPKTFSGTMKESDPCKPNFNLTDLLWSAVNTETAPPKSQAKDDSRLKDLLIFSESRYNHPISMAKAQMAYMLGDLSEPDQQKFDEKWAFYFQHPSDETTAYFNKLVPLLANLIEKRNQLIGAVLARKEAQKDADDAAAYENKAVAAQAQATVNAQEQMITVLDTDLKALLSQISALGDPPNPLANACHARKKHEDSKKLIRDLLKASITPAKLKGKTGENYTFTPEISQLKASTKLYWDFGDGVTLTAASGDVKHTFKKPGKYFVKLSIINVETSDRHQIAEAKAQIVGPDLSAAEGDNSSTTSKFTFIARDPFDVGKLPDGCVVEQNEGREEKGIINHKAAVHSYIFNVRIKCKDKIFTQGTATVENYAQPVPYKIYATPTVVALNVQYYPPHNASGFQSSVQSLSQLLNNSADMKRWNYEPYKFQGWNANGRIASFGSVKRPLSPSEDRIRHEVHFYGAGQERTLISFNVQTLVGYFESSSDLKCMKDGRWCGNSLENSIRDKFRKGLQAQLDKTRVDYYYEMEKLLGSIRLKGLPYPYNEVKEAPRADVFDESWFNVDEEGLTPEEIFKRKKQALLDAENFYKSNIEILQKNLTREQADYEREKDPDRKAAFFFRIMAINADIQAEQDKIETLHTGKIVHTPTQYDDYMKNKFISRIKDEQEKYVKLQRAAAIIRKEVDKLPAGEKEKAKLFVDKHLSGKTLAQLDEKTVKQVGDAIFNKTQGYNEKEAARYEQEALMWDDYTTRAERVKMWADLGMVGCSFLGGPMAVSSIYDISTGYFQGGIKEAATQMVMQAGAYALGKYMGAGAKASAAAEESKQTGSWTSKIFGKGSSAQEEAKLFAANRAKGEKSVKEFMELNDSLKKAYLNKAAKDEISVIKKQIRDKIAEIQANPHAKNMLKYNGDKLTQTRFIRGLKNIHRDVEKKFFERMKGQPYNWSDFQIKEMRNASSAGSVGMDFDIGLIEKANFVKMADGTMKPQYWLLKDGKPATRKLWQKEAQECWNDAYKEVTGHSAEKSWETLTTRIHPESYQDLAVLDGDMSKLSKAWVQQTSDVTRYKAMHMLKDDALTKYEKLQEISRGTAKDINTKLIPLLGTMERTKQVTNTAEHWKQVTAVLDDFGKNKIDPITAERRIAQLTGGKSIPETVDDMAYMMESIVKLGKKR